MSDARILDLIFAPWATGVLFTASRLGVFSALDGGPMTAEEISRRVGAEPRLSNALLDACVAMGLLERREGRYGNSHLAGVHLVEGKPLYLGDLIAIQAREASGGSDLYERIRGGSGQAPQVPADEPDPRGFTLAMHNLAMAGEAEALATAVDLSGCETLVDIGCGSGAYSVALCRHHPALRATLLDRPEVLETTREIIRHQGMERRITTRAADIAKDPYGEELSAVLLSDVLYQDRETCMAILRSAHAALAAGGRLVIRGYFSDPDRTEGLFGALFVVKMVASDPAREAISVAKLQDWLRDVGFDPVESFPLTARSTCLTAVK